MTLDQLIDEMAAPACIAADGLVRSGVVITEGIYLDVVAKLRKTVGAASKVRGVLDPITVNFLQLGATVQFGLRLADLNARIAK